MKTLLSQMAAALVLCERVLADYVDRHHGGDRATAGLAAREALARLATEREARYCVDGTTDDDTFQADGQLPPFVIFDIKEQRNLPGEYPTREGAEKALADLLGMNDVADALDSMAAAATAPELVEGVVVVVSLAGDACSGEDEGVEGRYLAHFEEPVPRDRAATIALDAFHNSIAIGTLDDFDVSVETEDGQRLEEPEDAESYSSTIGAIIRQIA